MYVSKGEWHHICLICDEVNVHDYVDGVLTKTVIYNGGCLNGDVSVGGSYHGRMNDLRIYNHCLSIKEIQEISKCMVLHYPLNQIEKNRNLLLDTNQGTTRWGV